VKKKYFSGRKVFVARMYKGLNSKHLANLSGVTESHLIAIEQERESPSVHTIIALAKALDVNVEVLFE